MRLHANTLNLKENIIKKIADGNTRNEGHSLIHFSIFKNNNNSKFVKFTVTLLTFADSNVEYRLATTIVYALLQPPAQQLKLLLGRTH